MFYTYLWLKENGTPYYVGKGHGERAFRKGSPSKELIVIYPAESEAEAFETEVALIWYYGRKDTNKGCLINKTGGGQGFAAPKSETWLKRVTAANRAKAKDPKWLAKTTFQKGMTAWHKGKRMWPEGRTFSEEHKAKLSASAKGRKLTEETKNKIRTSIALVLRRKQSGSNK